jgi:hypothetical protein
MMMMMMSKREKVLACAAVLVWLCWVTWYNWNRPRELSVADENLLQCYEDKVCKEGDTPDDSH